MKTAVFTVVYPKVEPNIDEFLSSLQNQTFKDFELVIVNDGFAELENHLKQHRFRYTIKKFPGNHVTIRLRGIRYLSDENFSYVVFADADDYFDPYRVEKAVELLNKYDLVCNRISLFGETIDGYLIFGQRFKDGDPIKAEDLLHKNIMGMSNTAARVDVLIPCLEMIPTDIIAFDWLLFSLCLLRGHTCVFTDSSVTYYRQHSDNVASILNVSDEQIRRGLKVKTQHYAALSRHYPAYKELSESYRLLFDKTVDQQFFLDYCSAVRKNAPEDPIWWELIKTEKELADPCSSTTR